MPCGNLYGFTCNQSVTLYHVYRPDVTYSGHITQIDKLVCTITIAEEQREACAAMLARVMEVRTTATTSDVSQTPYVGATQLHTTTAQVFSHLSNV